MSASTFLKLAVLGLVPLALSQGGLVINPRNAGLQVGSHPSSVPIDLSAMVNNRAFAMTPGDANFDGIHSGYPAQFLPDSNFTYAGINYIFPEYKQSGDDNVLAQGQIITPPQGRYSSISMLVAAESAVATGYVNVTYTDNTTSSGPVLVDPFWSWPYPYGGDIVFPYYLTNSSVDYNRSMIYQSVNWLDSTKEVSSVTLPNVTSGAATGPGGAAENTRLHIFAVSLVSSSGSGISLEIQQARSTQLWMEGTNKTQIFETIIVNTGDNWILASNSVKVTVEAPGVKTVQPGIINRLRPGDRVIVRVGVINANGTEPGTTGEATLLITGAGVQARSMFNATFGIGTYEATYESIYTHESPTWYTGGKYGIFIHWGVYAVPGWGNSGKKEQYAEWYWWYMNQGIDSSNPADFYQYNLATYGPDHAYDDFIQNFTTEYYDPKEWVDLFADAGAQYFVQVSKHHEGYALFDIPSNITKRTSVAQVPHKNLLQMLFDAADQYQPHLHKATYFSLPEWFHPDYKKYGFGDSNGAAWPGGLALDPYTNQTLPYTGYVPVNDFVSDLILPEMQILAQMGTEIMWCDIGGPNLTAEFSAEYFNNMAAQGKQVLINNRCGLPGDFDTPEYARYEAVQMRKWESNLGMDAFSYGYNRATPVSAYITPAEIVTSLIDITSKNGNFLLDIGPQANGTIIDIEQQNLRAAGKWIKSHGEAIFNTTYWFITPEEGDAIRFTQTPDAFYILTLYPPNSTLVLNSPVPYVNGDQVTVVGGNMSGSIVPSSLLSNGSLELTISDAVIAGDEYSWVFKIPFGDVAAMNATYTGSAPPAQQTTSGAGKWSLGWMRLSFSVVLGFVLWLA